MNKSRKGQFMIISAIIISLLIMSASAAVSDVKRTGFSPNKEAYYANMIADEVKKVDAGDQEDIESFQRMVSDIDRYSSTVKYWDRPSGTDCFNVTLRSPGSVLKMNCLKVN
ncbi:MAG: hypothetical protein ABEK00_03290 [Candidatus Nanohaloarchaea archaeon]